jgi:hypothetical protein
MGRVNGDRADSFKVTSSQSDAAATGEGRRRRNSFAGERHQPGGGSRQGCAAALTIGGLTMALNDWEQKPLRPPTIKLWTPQPIPDSPERSRRPGTTVSEAT